MSDEKTEKVQISELTSEDVLQWVCKIINVSDGISRGALLNKTKLPKAQLDIYLERLFEDDLVKKEKDSTTGGRPAIIYLPTDDD